MEYESIKISPEQAATIAKKCYNLKGMVTPLDGELDFNFRLQTDHLNYILKISRPGVDAAFVDFQDKILLHLQRKAIHSPEPIPDINNQSISEYVDEAGNKRYVRLLRWLNGRLWSAVNPITDDLLNQLGKQGGLLTDSLKDFDHPYAHKALEWDVAHALWTKEYLHLFKEEDKEFIAYFIHLFENQKSSFDSLRKAVVHNDGNDNNIVVTTDLQHPEVVGIIDYGDAIYTQVINDLAIIIAYAAMLKSDPLGAAKAVVKSYHSVYPLTEQEITHLFTLVAMRLIISVTKSAINKQKEPENEYLQISEKPAWELLRKWYDIHPRFAHYSFRTACGFNPLPTTIEELNIPIDSVFNFFPDLKRTKIKQLDLSLGSKWIGHEQEYGNSNYMAAKIDMLQQLHPESLICGGYKEIRPIYTSKDFELMGNNGRDYRSVHLGLDIWVKAMTPLYAIADGKVFSLYDNDADKDYGPTLILQHSTVSGHIYYTLYGHLSRKTFDVLTEGISIEKGQLIGYIGHPNENGNWAPHLHFQVVMDMLGNTHEFPGVASFKDLDTWQAICPDPAILFKEEITAGSSDDGHQNLLDYRKRHLGKSLSVSYDIPLKMQRGKGAYLMDDKGRCYLDTVNNVAHAGHEHPRVVEAGRQQMAVLNTNTRYLHENINAFTEELLATLPPELCVVHFVNSGSEANELALRMARTFTGQHDMLAVEAGYHGNTGACVDVSSYKFDGKGGKGAPEFTHIVPMPDSFRGKHRGDKSGKAYAEYIYQAIKSLKQQGKSIAGFICESILSCGGQIVLPDDYLKKVYGFVREAGGLCIADEVQVGCGRVGEHFWGFELQGVVPDIVTIGKPIGNGHPLAAVVCTREVADAFANGMEYFNTFGGNPVSCAIGTEVLRVIKDEGLQAHALEISNHLIAELTGLQAEFPIIADVRGKGLFLGFELCDKSLNPLREHASYLANRMKTLGILMSTDGKDVNVLKIKPPMVFNKEDANYLIHCLKQVLNEDFMQSY